MLRFSAVLLALALVVSPARAQSLDQMAGQMIVVGFAGDETSDKSVKAIEAQLAAGELGGVMFLKPNVKSLSAVAAMNAAFRAASPDLPPFITLDQEGGAVERLTAAVGFAEVPNAATVATQDSPEEAEALYSKMAISIAKLGFTVNFGPVADINTNPNNQIIAKFGRAFGKDAETVAAYDAAFIRAHHAAGLLTALKHFPGHGSSTADSHEGFVDISKSWATSELDPYRALIGEGVADMVMVGHLFHRDYAGAGKVKLPASLSPEWIQGVLRGELKFSGVVITDDMEMAAVRDHFPLRERIVRAVRAGVDVLLFSNTARPRPEIADEIRAILVSEAEADPAFRQRIEESYARIVALKRKIDGSDLPN
ncbi:MAG: glycoside hydrolase family 3 N-terminal domain-containing protein [Devosia sp.]